MKQTIPLSTADFIDSIEQTMAMKELAPIMTIFPPTLYTRTCNGLMPSHRLCKSDYPNESDDGKTHRGSGFYRLDFIQPV